MTTSTDLAESTASDLLDAAREIAAFCAENAAESDRDGGFPEREMALIAGSGLLEAPFSRSLGGLGLGCGPGGMSALLRLLTVLGSGNLSVARLYEGHANALLLIQQFGAADQVERFASAVRRDRSLSAVWNTEDADGVRLIPAGDERLTLRGAKTFASGAGFIERPLITAALPDGGWQMALLDLAPGDAAVDQSGWRPIGMKASASGRIDFTGLTVGRDALIGASGDYYRQPWFSAGAIRFAAAQLGGAVALADLVRAELTAHGRAENDAQRTRMGQIAIGTESARLWLENAAQLADVSSFGGADDPVVSTSAIVAYANMTRTIIERICLDTIEAAQRSAGARALLAPHPIERISRDLAMYLRQPAPDAVLRDAGEFVFAENASMLDLWGRP